MFEQAALLYAFFAQFTGRAYVNGEVPLGVDDEPSVPFPYVVYDLIQPEYGDTSVMQVIIYTKPANGSIIQVNELTNDLNAAIPVHTGTTLLDSNGSGALLLKRNASWAEKYNVENRNIKAMRFAVEITSLIKGD